MFSVITATKYDLRKQGHLTNLGEKIEGQKISISKKRLSNKFHIAPKKLLLITLLQDFTVWWLLKLQLLFHHCVDVYIGQDLVFRSVVEN